jgi:hypothetical protein
VGTRANAMGDDHEYCDWEGWKIHLTIGPIAYEKRVKDISDWLHKNFRFDRDWKHLEGGDKHEKDFTIYLGSYATMMYVVQRLENDPIIKQLDVSNAGPADRIVGESGKIGARFTTNDLRIKGLDGIPVADKDAAAVLIRGKALATAIQCSKASLRKRFGDYFLPLAVE